MIEPRPDETGIDSWAISGHKWQCGPGGTGILYIRNRQHPANPTPLPRFHIIRSSAGDIPFDGSRPADFDIGAAMSRYGFPESADWRALGDVCALWDEIRRSRIQAWTHNLADDLRSASRPRSVTMRCCSRPSIRRLTSAIVCFNPFPGDRQRCNPDANIEFRERLLREIRVSHLGWRCGARRIHSCARPRGGVVSPRPRAQPRSRYACTEAVRLSAACQRLRLELPLSRWTGLSRPPGSRG